MVPDNGNFNGIVSGRVNRRQSPLLSVQSGPFCDRTPVEPRQGALLYNPIDCIFSIRQNCARLPYDFERSQMISYHFEVEPLHSDRVPQCQRLDYVWRVKPKKSNFGDRPNGPIVSEQISGQIAAGKRTLAIGLINGHLMNGNCTDSQALIGLRTGLFDRLFFK